MRDIDYILDQTFVVFGDKVYRQTMGVPMGFNCSPMIAILTLSFYEIAALRTFRKLTLRPDGMRVPTPQGEVNMTPRVRTRLMSFVCRLSRCARAVDDVLFIDLSTTERLWAVKHMYPPELQLKEVCASPDRIFYLDMEILRDRGGFFTTMYDKRDELAKQGLMGVVRKFPHIDSLLSNRCKYGVLTGFLHRAFRIEMRVSRFVTTVANRIVFMMECDYTRHTLFTYARRFMRAHYTPRHMAASVNARIDRSVCRSSSETVRPTQPPQVVSAPTSTSTPVVPYASASITATSLTIDDHATTAASHAVTSASTAFSVTGAAIAVTSPIVTASDVTSIVTAASLANTATATFSSMTATTPPTIAVAPTSATVTVTATAASSSAADEDSGELLTTLPSWTARRRIEVIGTWTSSSHVSAVEHDLQSDFARLLRPPRVMYSRLNAEVATQSIGFPDLLHPSMSAAMATVDTVRTMTGIGTDILTTVGPSTENIPLRGVDFATLRSRSQVSNTRDLYLNDACIDAWGALVTDNEVCVFSSLVVSHLFDGRGPHVIPTVADVVRWVRRMARRGIDLFTCRAWVFPMCQNLHWRVGIVSFESRSVSVVDPLGAQPAGFTSRLCAFVAIAHFALHGSPWSMEGWIHGPLGTFSPLQPDLFSCGLFPILVMRCLHHRARLPMGHIGDDVVDQWRRLITHEFVIGRIASSGA